MKEIFEKINEYHTVDGNVKIVLSKKDYDYLKKYVAICDEIVGGLKLGIYAEHNEALSFRKKEMTEPALSNYCIMYKASEKEWKNVQKVLRENYERKYNKE